MTYVLPQTLVFQDLSKVISVASQPLNAGIFGGHAYLLRYSDDDERPFGRLGIYDNAVDQSFEWPQRPAGGVVDHTYTKLWIKDALLQYFSDSVGAGSVIAKVAGSDNRIRAADINFATNGVYARDGVLLDRDVRAGDVAKVRALPEGEGAEPVTIWTYVRALVGDAVAAVIGSATSDENNAQTQGANVTVTKTAGSPNCIEATADADAYDGLPSGRVSETYRIVVLDSSVGGDLTTARVRVLSGSGTDDVSSLNPAAAGETTAIGTRGLLVTFDANGEEASSQSAEDAGVSAVDLIAGQTWLVEVDQAFTETTPTGSGTYEETNDTTYIATVTKGGVWADLPQISVTTTNSIDMSGPTVVTAAATPVVVGTQGLRIAFSGTGLCKGDRFYIEVVGVKTGPMKTIVLGHNLPDDVADGTDVDLTLYIRKPLLEVPQNRVGQAPLVNFEGSETEFTVKSGIEALDTTWTDEGVPQSLAVCAESSMDYGLMYVEYRAWRSDLANEIGTITDIGEIDSLITGALTPDNPLKWGVFMALTNANGSPVKFCAVSEPDELDAWDRVVELLLGEDEVYGLVPLTRDQLVLDLFLAHVNSMSSATNGLWRVLWVNLQGMEQIPVVSAGSTVSGHVEATTENGQVCLCTFADDPDTSGSQFTIMRNPSGNGQFVTNGVRPGDTVRALYVSDGFDNYTWSEFTIDEVTSENQLRLMTGPDAPQTVPAKIEIWRDLSATEESAEIANNAGAWGNRRVRAVWPDRIEAGGTVMEGYFLCAALSGYTSGVLPQQGMTRLAISGFTDVPRTTSKFNRPQLDHMAEAGTWIVTQNMQTGTIYTRHAVTTGVYADLNQREEMLTRNVDSISYRVKATYEPYIGVANVTPNVMGRLKVEMLQLISLMTREGGNTSVGGQLIAGEITRLEQHETMKDRVVIVLKCTVPYALNNIEVHLEV